MRQLLTIFCLFSLNCYATNYYFAASGNDNSAGTSLAPWQTIAKFNSVFASRSPGDNFLFNRGDVFYGTLNISRSGSSGLPITIGAYGSGANPVITGFVSIAAWTNLGGNLWESTFAPSTLSTCNMVVINGVNTAMGRTPNSGYYTISTGGSTTSLTSGSLNAAIINYTGAEAVIRKVAWVTDRNVITSHLNSTINFTAPDSYNTVAGWGFFIQNDVRTLDVQNEWYYNPSTKKIRIYSTSMPSNVQVSTIDTLVKIQGRNFITFDGVDFTGANKYGFQISAANITIQNCRIDYSGVYAVWGAQNLSPSTNFVFQNNTINHSGNNGIDIRDNFTGALIQNNIVKNTGILEGMTDRLSNGNGFGNAIQTHADNTLIQYNQVDSCGYAGINFYNNGDIIQYNFVNHALYKLGDGGGIYQWTGWNGSGAINPLKTGQKILHNIVINCQSPTAGTLFSSGILNQGQGIYADDVSANEEIAYNSVANCGYSGIFLHNTTNMNVHDNTLFNNGIGFTMNSATSGINTPNPIRTTTFKNNIVVSQVAAQPAAYYNSQTTDITSFGSAASIDSNYLARPIDDNLVMKVQAGAVSSNKNLAQWVTYSAFDAHSKKSPVIITSPNQLDFEYNATNSPAVKTLGPGVWIDVYNTQYSGTVTLQAYSSVILINTGVNNTPPVANAGGNKNITLPTSSTTQSGSGSDPDGSVVGYAWTQISGPATVSFGSATSATTTVTGMTVAGTYQVQLRVTDNLGATGTDIATIIVNASPPPNIPPTANAGGNKVITLPTSTVTQAGSGNDPDGSISSYAWTQVSGPAASIVSPSSATTVINGLTGTSQFVLTVTDNLGATGSASATIIVNSAPNQPPSANAGSDQTITYPANATLSGSGSDPDGVIVSYAWSKVSGDDGAIITNPSSASTTVTNLFTGVYRFRLQITDDSGGTASDTMQLTVNPQPASISFTVLSKAYTGGLLQPDVLTSPAGLAYNLTLNGVSGGKIPVGSYTAVANVIAPNYSSSPISATFTITKGLDTIIASNKTVNANGNPQTITATTTKGRSGSLVYTYNGISSPPSAIGAYQVIIHENDANYQSVDDTVTLNIVSSSAIIFISDTFKIYNASPQTVTVTSAYSYTLTGVPQTLAGIYPGITATINDGIHTGSATATLTIAKKPAALSWAQSPAIPQGAQLTSAILNAQADIPGHFDYSPALGFIPPLGVSTLSATFIPDDPSNYSGATITTTINVYAQNEFLNFYIIGPDGVIYVQQ